MTQPDKEFKNATRVHTRALSMLTAITDASLYQSWEKEDLDNMAEAAMTLLDQAKVAAAKCPELKPKLNQVFSSIFENLLIWRDQPDLAIKTIKCRITETSNAAEIADANASLFFAYAYTWKYHDLYPWQRNETYTKILKIYAALAPDLILLTTKRLMRIAYAWSWLNRPEMTEKILKEMTIKPPVKNSMFVEPKFWLEASIGTTISEKTDGNV